MAPDYTRLLRPTFAARRCDLFRRSSPFTHRRAVREAVFVRRHAADWRAFEERLENGATPDPDALADGYVRMGDDLAYAKTFYPGSPTAAYLNDLSAEVHSRVYRNRREERGRFARFWRHEVPMAVYESRRALLVALALFLGAAAVGWVSATGDDAFVRLIMGDAYVEMTQINIEAGDPFAVYKHGRSDDLATGLIFHNIRVSFIAFVGLLALAGTLPVPAGSVGTGWTLINNGIMLGAFYHMFWEAGLSTEFFRVVFIHGTPEISAIVIAGGAGLTMWNALLFPGTYPRRVAFMRGAKRALKIVVALVPVFIYAGVLEGFVTRLTQMPTVLSWSLIAVSLAAVVGYFVYLPWRVGAASRAETGPRS